MKKNKKRASASFITQNSVQTADFVVDTNPVLSTETPIEKNLSAIIMALMMLCSLSFTYSFCSMYQLDTAITGYTTTGMALFPIAFFLGYTFIKKRRFLFDIAALIGMIAFAAANISNVILGTKQFLNGCIEALGTRTYAFLPTFKISSAENQNDQVALVMFLFLFFVEWVIARSMYAKPNPFVLIAVTLIPMVPGLFLGLVPTPAMFMMLVICYCVTFSLWATEKHKSSKGKDYTAKVGKRDNIKFTYSGKLITTGATQLLSAIALGTAIMAFLVAGLFYNESVYNNETLVEIRTNIYRVLRGDTQRLLGINGGRLGVLESYEPNTEDPLITVTTANMGTTIYIKNFTGDTYTGTRWRELDGSDNTAGELKLNSLFADKGFYATNVMADYLNTYRYSDHAVVQNSYVTNMSVLIRDGIDYTRTFAPYNALFPKVGSDGEPLEYGLDTTPAMSATTWVRNYNLEYIVAPSVMDLDLSEITNAGIDAVNEQKRVEIIEIIYRQLEEEKYTKFFKITKEQLSDLLTVDVITQAGTAQGMADYMVNYLKNHEYAYKYESEPLMADMSAEEFAGMILTDLEPCFETVFLTESTLGEIESAEQERSDAYNAYVYETYTELPSQNRALDELKKTFGQVLTVKFRENFDTLGELITYVQNYLWERVEYDTADTKLPEDKDFVNYFLYNEGRGYSTLYASAATLILRAAGVPARYCEGFIIQPADYAKATPIEENPIYSTNLATGKIYPLQGYYFPLTENYMHAWCEIYIDGYGWVPVEMTPGYVNDTTVDPELIDNTTIGGSVITPGNGGGGGSITVDPVPDDTVTFSEMYILKNMTPGTVFGMIIAVLLGVAALAAAVVAARRYYKLQSIARSMHTEDFGANVRALYAYMMSLLIASGYMAKKNHGYEKLTRRLQRRFTFVSPESIEEMVRIMVKSKFSDEAVTENEYKFVLDIVNRMRKQIDDALSGKKKLVVSYLYALL